MRRPSPHLHMRRPLPRLAIPPLAHTGLVGFAEEEEVDRKRASFLTSDGGFNANAFGSSLTRSRVHTAAALSGVRVVPALIAFGIGYHYMPQLIEMRAEIEAQLALNWRLHPWTCLLPVLPVGGLMYQVSSPHLT